jgi:hypothetical protein
MLLKINVAQKTCNTLNTIGAPETKGRSANRVWPKSADQSTPFTQCQVLFTHVLANCAHTIGKQRLCRRKREEGTEERQSDTHTHTHCLNHTHRRYYKCLFRNMPPIALDRGHEHRRRFHLFVLGPADCKRTGSDGQTQIAGCDAASSLLCATNITQDTPRV